MPLILCMCYKPVAHLHGVFHFDTGSKPYDEHYWWTKRGVAWRNREQYKNWRWVERDGLLGFIGNNKTYHACLPKLVGTWVRKLRKKLFEMSLSIYKRKMVKENQWLDNMIYKIITLFSRIEGVKWGKTEMIRTSLNLFCSYHSVNCSQKVSRL